MNWGAIESASTLAIVIATFAVSLVNYGVLKKSVQELERRTGLLEEWKERKQEAAELAAAGNLNRSHSLV